MQDKLYYKAKREGYRARSAYKLLELQKKYYLIKKGDCVLDLGCAPGSWLQVVSGLVGKGIALGVDISPAKPVGDDVIIWKESVMNPGFIQKLKGFLIENGRVNFSVIISDMAPKTKGVPYVDQNLSLELAMRAYAIAKEVLVNGGNFICKVFQSKEAEEFIQQLRKSFSMVKMVSVDATRKGSREMYYVCLGYKSNKI